MNSGGKHKNKFKNGVFLIFTWFLFPLFTEWTANDTEIVDFARFSQLRMIKSMKIEFEFHTEWVSLSRCFVSVSSFPWNRTTTIMRVRLCASLKAFMEREELSVDSHQCECYNRHAAQWRLVTCVRELLRMENNSLSDSQRILIFSPFSVLSCQMIYEKVMSRIKVEKHLEVENRFENIGFNGNLDDGGGGGCSVRNFSCFCR